ncbi:8652_t:CDS:1, partial [Funneliformis caledonium]
NVCRNNIHGSSKPIDMSPIKDGILEKKCGTVGTVENIIGTGRDDE